VPQPHLRKIDFAALLQAMAPDSAASLQQMVVVAAGADARAVPSTTFGTASGPRVVVHTQRSFSLHVQPIARAMGNADGGVRLLAAHRITQCFGSGEMFQALLAHAPAPACPALRLCSLARWRGGGGRPRHLVRPAADRGLYGPREMQALFAVQALRRTLAERLCWVDGFPVVNSANGTKIRRLRLRAMARASLVAELAADAPAGQG
jgi:fatty-acyl-CoA synthase